MELKQSQKRALERLLNCKTFPEGREVVVKKIDEKYFILTSNIETPRPVSTVTKCMIQSEKLPGEEHYHVFAIKGNDDKENYYNVIPPVRFNHVRDYLGNASDNLDNIMRDFAINFGKKFANHYGMDFKDET